MIKFKVYPCNPHHTTSSAFQTPSLPQAATGNVWSLTPRVHDLRSWQFDSGVVEFALPEGYEYWSESLMQHLVIMRLLYVDKQRRSKGIGTEILKKVLEVYKDSQAAIVIYPIPVELKGWTHYPQMVEDLSHYKKSDSLL